MDNDRSEFLGTEKIFPLLIKMALPAAAGMLVQALYNIVDTIFVGRGVGPMAIGALSIVFPVQMIVSSVAMALGVGTASIVSRRLGEKKYQDASAAVGTGYTAMLAGTVILVGVLFLFMKPILVIFGVTPKMMPMAAAYTRTVIPGFFFFAFASFSSNVVRAEGNAKGAMIGMMIGAVLNCFLDPVFIFIFGLGVRGAALATTLSQIVSSLYFLSIYIRRKNAVEFSFASLRIEAGILKEASLLGIPPFIQNAGMSILALIINNTLGVHGGEAAIINYGMSHRFISLMILPLLGLAQGFQPIAGYNYGAGNFSRLRQILKTAILCGISVTAVVYVVAIILPERCMGLFTSDSDIVESSAAAFRILIMMIPIVPVQIIGTAYFQAVGKAKQSMILGLSRQFLFLIPLVLILPAVIGLRGIWSAFPIADVVSTALTSTLLVLEVRKMKSRACYIIE